MYRTNLQTRMFSTMSVYFSQAGLLPVRCRRFVRGHEHGVGRCRRRRHSTGRQIEEERHRHICMCIICRYTFKLTVLHVDNISMRELFLPTPSSEAALFASTSFVEKGALCVDIC